MPDNSYNIDGNTRIEFIEVTVCFKDPKLCTTCMDKYGNCTTSYTLIEWHKIRREVQETT